MTIDPKDLPASAVMTFSDDFNSLSLWNGTSGTWLTTYPWSDVAGNGSTLNDEQEWYINSQYAKTAHLKPWSVSNSILSLIASKVSAADALLVNGYSIISGQMNTYKSFNQKYGYFECRAQLPKGQGFWPAFWMDRQDLKWPPEIDVMEVLGRDVTKLYTTVHTQQNGTHESAGKECIVADMSSGFHTYGVDWEKDFTVFYFDRAEVFRTPTPADMHEPMFLMVNLGVGGSWGGPADASTPLPGRYLIDYVKAYKPKDGSVLAPKAPSTPSPTPPPPPPSQPASGTVAVPQGGGTYPGGTGAPITYAWSALPWTAATIQGFRVGTDRLDLSALGSGPVNLASDPQGVSVKYGKDTGSAPWPTTIAILVGLSSGGLVADQLIHPIVMAPNAFRSALDALVDGDKVTSSADKIVELRREIARLGG